MQLVTDPTGKLIIAACSGTALGASGARLSHLAGWYSGLPREGVSTALHVGGMAYQMPNGDPTPLRVARRYPPGDGVETWGCNPGELWEMVMQRPHRKIICHWRDAPPVIPVVHGGNGLVVAAVVCHYDPSSGAPDLLLRLRDLSLLGHCRKLLMELPASLPRILLVGGRRDIGLEYDTTGNMAVSVGVFNAEAQPYGGAVVRLQLRNPVGSIDQTATRVVFSDYSKEWLSREYGA